MKKFKWFLMPAIVLFLALNLSGAFAQTRGVVSEDDSNKILQALPSKPTSPPHAKRRLLVFSRCEGYFHSVIPLANRAFELMGEKTGAFEVEFSEDMSVFTPENLQRFDAILFNNTTMLKFENPEQRKALMDFVKSGKGIIGVHAATDNFYDWPEAAEMMGGLFDGHPWGAGGTWAIKIDDPKHPLNRAFEGKGFTIKDEIYQLKSPYSRDKLRVLLSLDMTRPENLAVQGIKRDDKDHAVSWIREYQGGRVFYCSLGHNPEIFMNPALLRHYLDGIQFALGDLEASTTPSAELSQSNNSDKELNPYQELLNYDFGKSRKALSLIEENIRKATPQERKTIEAEMVSVLESPLASFASKQFACRMLRRAGTQRSVSPLAPLLTDERLSHMARYALEEIPGYRVDRALRSALGKTQGDLKIGIISSLGKRGDRRSVQKLAHLAESADLAIAQASIMALGRIGGKNAEKAIKRAKGTGELQSIQADALLACADAMLDEGKDSDAIEIYRDLSTSEHSVITRIAAYRGLVRIQKEGALSIIQDLLKSNNLELQKAAGQMIAEMPGSNVTQTFAELLAPLSIESQQVLIDALTARGDPAAAVAIERMAESRNEVRRAALEALGTLGSASSIDLLIDALDSEALKPIAKDSLIKLRGKDVDSALLQSMREDSLDDTVRALLTQILVARHAVEAIPTMLTLAAGGEGSVAREALKGLAELAGEDQLPALVEILQGANDNKIQSEAVKAYVAIASRIPEPSRRAQPILTALESESDVAKRSSLLEALGRIATPEALEPLRLALHDENEEIQKTAIRALSEWPNADPLEDLRNSAANSPDLSRRVLALRGYANMLTLAQARDRSVDEVVKLYEEGLKSAERSEEKLLLLAGLGEVRHPHALELVEPYMKDAQLESEAKVAAERIVELLNKPASAEASNASEDANKALDGDPNTRWTTNGLQKPGQWFTIDLGFPLPIRGITLDAGSQGNDTPKGYEVYLSLDGSDWGSPVAQGEGKNQILDIDFETHQGRYIKIVQTGSNEDYWWSISEVKVKGFYGLAINKLN